MADRKWDELNNDSLVQIFARVGTESLAEYIPFVCKSWYYATLNPLCWTTLTFSSEHLSVFVKYAVGRSQSCATAVEFVKDYSEVPRDDLLCIAEGCPLLKTLIMSEYVVRENYLLLSELIGNWKHLEYLEIYGLFYLDQILESISLHCHNFASFVMNNTITGNEEVSAIAKFIPKIKFLRMRSVWMSRECLVMLLKGCAALETLDLSECIAIKDGDDEIMKLASHINSFKRSGTRIGYEHDSRFVNCTSRLAGGRPVYSLFNNSFPY